jgi:AcrR family transcriptional regulator
MSRAASRPRLNRGLILRTGLEFADANGIEALKMRELARELGFEAMALYRHVANKEEILEGLVDLVLSEVEMPSAGADWAASIRAGAISFHAAIERHPWVAGLLTKPPGLRPARLEFAESLLARLEEAGFSEDVRFHAYHVLDAWIIGYSLWLAGHSLTPAERQAVNRRLADDGPLDDYPRLLEHHDQHAIEGGHRDVSAFEVGLDLILEGLKESATKKRPSGA